MNRLFRNNSLSLIFLFFFLVTLVLQSITGLKEYNETQKELGGRQVGMGAYLKTGHFIEATFENWESEFLQMALFVVLSAFLYQKGSSESKDPDKKDEVDNEPDPAKKDAPWPVRKGGFILSVYKYSLSYALFLLFFLSFIGHWYGSLKDYNEEQSLKHLPLSSAMNYLSNSRLWFESFENWQSEFLSVLSIVVFTIFLRHKGSAQSKPVDVPNSHTGE